MIRFLVSIRPGESWPWVAAGPGHALPLPDAGVTLAASAAYLNRLGLAPPGDDDYEIVAVALDEGETRGSREATDEEYEAIIETAQDAQPD